MESGSSTEATTSIPVTKVKGKRKRNLNLEKPHSCIWPGCTKSFSRPDHLARHALNHVPLEVFVCDRCAKEFVRADLLARHRERHEKREAGGEPADGTAPGLGRRKSKGININTNNNNNNMDQSGNSPTSPTNDILPLNNSLPMHHQQILNGGQLPILPSWNNMQFQSQQHSLPPFDYFDASIPPLGFPSSSSSTSLLQPGNFNNNNNNHSNGNNGNHNNHNNNTSPTSLNQTANLSAFSPVDFTASNPSLSSAGLPYLDDPLSTFIQASYGAMNYSNYDWLFAPDSNYDVTLLSSRPATPGNEFATPGFDSTYGGNNLADLLGAGFEVEPHIWSGPGPSSVDSGPTTASPQEFLDRSCDVSASTRARIFSYLGPEWAHLNTDERLSVDSIREYLFLFWTRYDEAQASSFHRSSFRTSKAPAALLIAMMLVGTYFSSIEAHQIAVLIHPSFRGKLFSSADFRPRAGLWVHQTLVLLVVFGKMLSSRISHEMSHIFWSSVITLGRRSTLFSVKSVDTSTIPSTDPEVMWAEWVVLESSKRIAFLTFSIDSEHAAFFRHSISLSAFQLQLPLPCSEAEWEATTATDWLRIHNDSKPQVPFISALKASLVPQGNQLNNNILLASLNSASRVAVLHGLISVAQDLQWRDHVIGFGQPESRAHNWREMMSAAYNTWKAALDSNLIANDSPSSTQLLRSSISLYAVAHITLSIDIHELQIFAGAVSALGIIVTDAVREASRARMKVWSSTKEGKAACWHSAFFLRSSLQNDTESIGIFNNNSSSLHHGWCIYQATLAIYCFGICTDGPAPEVNLEGRDLKDETMIFLDRMCTNSPTDLDAVPNKNEVLSVIETTYEYLRVSRWEIAQEASAILKRLLPWYNVQKQNKIESSELLNGVGNGGKSKGKENEMELV